MIKLLLLYALYWLMVESRLLARDFILIVRDELKPLGSREVAMWRSFKFPSGGNAKQSV